MATGFETAKARNAMVLKGLCPDDGYPLYAERIDGEAWLACPVLHRGDDGHEFHVAYQAKREPTPREREFGIRWQPIILERIV